MHNDSRDGQGDFDVRADAAAMKYPSVDTLTQVILGLGILIGLVVVGTVIVQRFRGGIAGNRINESDLITNFQEMRCPR